MIEVNKLIKPALIAGVIAGILSVIPIINFVNCICCGWIVIFGFVSVYLLKKDIKTVEPIDGAIVGALTGLIAFVVVTIIKILFTSLFVGSTGMSGSMEYMELNAFVSGAYLLMSGVMRIIIFPIFGAFGGIIGVVILKDKEEPKVEYQTEDVVEEQEDVIEEEK